MDQNPTQYLGNEGGSSPQRGPVLFLYSWAGYRHIRNMKDTKSLSMKLLNSCHESSKLWFKELSGLCVNTSLREISVVQIPVLLFG